MSTLKGFEYNSTEELIKVSVKFIVFLKLIVLQPCHVVYTDFRPTPLQHYIYPAGGEGLFLVQDEKVGDKQIDARNIIRLIDTTFAVAKRERGKLQV